VEHCRPGSIHRAAWPRLLHVNKPVRGVDDLITSGQPQMEMETKYISKIYPFLWSYSCDLLQYSDKADDTSKKILIL
jgi:hypothetical protein